MKRKKYECSYCKKRFANWNGWFFKHYLKKHPDMPIKCKEIKYADEGLKMEHKK